MIQSTGYQKAKAITFLFKVLTESGVAQLPADHGSIIIVPGVVTNSAPSIVYADLNSSFKSGGTANKPDTPSLTSSWNKLI